ncbi:MAG: leucine-rich repeat domain-containing protein [Bryobacterales bacterium]|nr:leucine-rich repeat domain-containing protein [Bryobacterales bacterium]
MTETQKTGRNTGVQLDPLQEAMRRIEEAERTGAAELDLSKLALGPILPADWRGWEALGGLDKLRNLKLGENQISTIPAEGWKALGQLAGLTWLDFRRNQLAAIPSEGWEALGRLDRLSFLDLAGNGLMPLSTMEWEALARMSTLKHLFLQDNRIGDIPREGWETLGRLSKLSTLFLSRNGGRMAEEGWKALSRLRDLETLSLAGFKIGKPSAENWATLGNLRKLGSLLMSGNEVGDIPAEGWQALGRLTSLRRLWLMNNNLTKVPAVGWTALGQLSGLEELDLSYNRIDNISLEGWNVLSLLSNLRVLHLEANTITNVPAEGWDALSRLQNLEKLFLKGNQISNIPLEGWDQGRFAKLEELNLSGNPLPEDLLTAASRGPRSFLEYLEAARVRAAHPRTVKLMLLGEPAAGKTTLVEALSGNQNPCDPNRPETIGVNVRRIQKNSAHDGRPLYFATWDFAGQHMEYATHQFFLKSGGIYVILWKARLGSDYGQRDLWYWLELLRMRVKDPEFLLVTTHTGTTPSALDVREVQSSYPGFRGHFEVELCDGTGLAALEERLLELAGASPSMRAVWPAPWLAVRDAVREMRAQSPYISATEFWRLCAKHEVNQMRAQRDLADQLDKLGEIVYYADDPLSRFVILDPTWVTELVAKVVRDRQVRDQDGTLNPADLDRIWGDLPTDVRDHLENLMDEYDLAYKMLVHDHARSSIVVEALPPAPEEIRTLDIAGTKPQTEMIYRFPTLVRHLPPGVPTWAFARSRRYLKTGTGPWRNSARFEDADTNSEAIVFSSELDREVRLRVAADYPPYFFGVLDGILRDTFRRYPGAQPESRIPCPCLPGCKYSHPRDTVLKRKRDGKAEITCPLSGEDVAIGKLLEGFAPVDSQAGTLAVLFDMRRQLSAIQNAQNEELIKECPSMFTLAPAAGFKLLDTYLEYATQQEELELTLYCEWVKHWHATQYSVYRFRPEREWFVSLKEKWGVFARVTKRVAPLAGIAGAVMGAPEVGVAAKEFAEKAEKMSAENEKDPSGSLAKELGLREHAGIIDLGGRHLLLRLIKHLDTARGEAQPEFGGLHPYLLKEDGRLLWLCAEHRELYERAR